MKLLILDRDGVINHDSEHYIKSPEEWVAIPGSLEAIARFNQAGWQVVVATNQSGIGRGYYTEAVLDAIHAKMQAQLQQVGGEIAKVFYCPHAPDDGCDCRKPKPGLLEQIANYYGCDLQGVPMVGDSIRDLQAAQQMNCKLFLVETGNGKKSKQKLVGYPELGQINIVDDLAAVADSLLAN